VCVAGGHAATLESLAYAASACESLLTKGKYRGLQRQVGKPQLNNKPILRGENK